MKIYDDVIKSENADQLEELFLSNLFPWYLVKRSSGVAPDRGYTDTLQMEHIFISHNKIQSPVIHQVMKLLEWDRVIKELDLKNEILRMKSNLLFNTKSTTNPPHIDLPMPHTVLLYYVNDSSGPTVFFKENGCLIEDKKIEPKKGRIVVFDGETYHASTPPSSNETRCVININLQPNT